MLDIDRARTTHQNPIENYLQMSPVIPVIVIDDVTNALPLAQALIDGGITIMEVTLRSNCSLEAISRIRDIFPAMSVGAGTITDVVLRKAAIEAGAQFLVSPGSTKNILDENRTDSIPLLPGAITPSEVMKLRERGFRFLKFFPAESAGGITMLKSLSGPLPDMNFCPTGGITPNNIESYLALSNVSCVGSSWMAEPALIRKKNWTEITQRTKAIVEYSTI